MAFKKISIPEYKIEVIGISGKKETGKCIYAEIIQDYIEKKNNRPVIKIGFAEHIKQTLLNLFSPRLTLDHLTTNKNRIIPGLGITGRRLLQNFGAYCKNINSTVWIDYIFKRRIPDCIYIIHDVRFPDEANAVLENNGLLIRLEANKEILDQHSTETALDNFNFPIILEVSQSIDGDLRYLLDKVVL